MDINGLGTEELSHVFVDNRNNLIVSAKNKLFLVDKKGGKFATGRQFICTGYSDIRGVVRSSHGDYWINVPSAVLRLDGNLNFIQTVNDKARLMV